jgi:hypothetical protein
MKCKPRKKLRIIRSLKFFFTKVKWKDFPSPTKIDAKTRHAIIKRQKAMENVSTFCRNRMKIEAVPKRMPAVMPSVKASFLVLSRIQTPFPLS